MKNEVILITGQRGSGKTTYLKEQIDYFDRVIIFDLLGEFTYYKTSLTLQKFFYELTDLKPKNFFTLNYYNPKTSEEDFEMVCKAINRLSDVMFVVDEIDYFCNAHMIPRDFDEIVKRGRHQALQLIVATRRPHEIPPIIRSQISRLVTFRHLEPGDLKYLREISGVEEDRIQALEDFHYIEWRSGKIIEGTVSKPKHKKGILDPEDTKHLNSAIECLT